MAFSVSVNGLSTVLDRLSVLDSDGGIFGHTQAIVTTGELLYAPFVSSGTRPHDIYPRNKKVLAWPGAGTPTRATGKARAGHGGNTVFAMHVHHPGTKPNPYVETAVAAMTAGVVLRISEAVTAIFDGAGRGTLVKALEASGLSLQAEIMRGAPVKTGTLRRSWHSQVSS